MKIVHIARLVIVMLLAIGSFLGFPNDPQLCGVFWMLTTILICMGGTW